MAHQKQDGQGFETQVAYFRDGVAIDGFDLAITPVPNDESGEHAKVELVFLQDKGSRKSDVTAAVKLQVFELRQLHDLIGRRLATFLPQREKS